MTTYHQPLPQQQSGTLFLSDGGIETTLIFQEGLELPYFSAFHLLQDKSGRDALKRYYERHIGIAKAAGAGFVLESPTWRASTDWGEKLGYSGDRIAAVNRDAIRLMLELRSKHETTETPMVVSGCVGPRGDGYDAGRIMSPGEAKGYHAHQIGAFAGAGADLVTAITMTNASEAIGVTRAAKVAGMPVVISFTLETDGRLPTGQALHAAIAEVDAATDHAPAYYMINCAHPLHFQHVLKPEPWMQRVRGIRANASKRSHAELDAAPDLDAGDPAELGAQYAAIRNRFPWINVLGGCCGTDHRHIEQICHACKQAE
jgi:S-methylmethionine-dependent homocysteine/selenocysteine methylase